MPRPHPTLETLSTSPMVIAVTYDVDGRRWPARVAEWVRTSDGWWANVIPERDTYRAGIRGGWIYVEHVEPAQHDVHTAHGNWQWWTWAAQAWPAELERFAGAAWNQAQNDRAEQLRPASVPSPDAG